ncbi:disease resistance-responsive (dirigent-like protein) family protein [Artemisia annua]|uniref:Dirigent protein n=1 Tax=Artemisia annua TaxID=35608 RepID=A0A2U1NJI6_ARTAN|nr:disease resistance-responsive (dirigent-like protein) family protein [Artemisia annua]
MAKIFHCFILLFIMALSQTISITQADPAFLQSIKKNPMKLKTEKLSHFKFYWHDIVSGPNPTAVTIVQPPANKTKNPLTGFGLINMIDDPLTEKPETGSKLLGRAQGFYGASSQEEIGLLMAMNFNFATRKAREMSVIGGSGVFRFARGPYQAFSPLEDVNLDMNDLEEFIQDYPTQQYRSQNYPTQHYPSQDVTIGQGWGHGSHHGSYQGSIPVEDDDDVEETSPVKPKKPSRRATKAKAQTKSKNFLCDIYENERALISTVRKSFRGALRSK